MYRIGLFSKLGKVTIKTLRYYDEMNLLVPAHIDENGYRYYTTDQLFRLHEIVSMKQMGLSILEIKALLDHHDIVTILDQRKKELELELSDITIQLSRLTNYILEKQEEKEMVYQAVIKEIPKCIVFSMRQSMPNYAYLNERMPFVGEKVMKMNPELKCTQPDYCFTINHDRAYKETDIDIEICQAVETFGSDSEGIVFKEMPEITVVSVLHQGNYETLREAYTYALKWLEDNGYVMSGSPRESFIDGVWNKNVDTEWLTEIQVPITKK